MADFTKWFVTGDGGLIEEFTEFTVENMLAEAFQQFQREEEARIAREEDEASWAAAREHMTRRLSVRYFCRWRDAARELSMRRILLEGKAKYKAAMEEKTKAKRDKARAEKKAAERKKAAEIAAREERLRNFTAADELEAIIAQNQQSRQSSAEEALLASGVFAGVKDERQLAKRVVKDAYLPAHKQHRPTSSLSSQQSMAPPSTTTPLKKEGWKTRSLREKLHMPRRDSLSSSSLANTGVSNLSRSLPVGGAKQQPRPPKTTNFSAASPSRKRGAETSDDEPEAKKGKVLKSGYTLHWELRRRGLVNMPGGQWLPARIASQMFEGRRFAGYGDCGLGPGKEEVVSNELVEPAEVRDERAAAPKENDRPAATPSARQSKLDALARTFGFPPTKRYRRDSSASVLHSSPSAYRESLSPSGGGSGGKRKRDAGDEDAGSPSSKKTFVRDESSDDESGGGTTTAQKVERALGKMRRQLRGLNEDMDLLESEEGPWMREQMGRLAGGEANAYGGLSGGVRDEGGF